MRSPRTKLLISDVRQTVLGAVVPPASKRLSHGVFGWRPTSAAEPPLGFNGQRAEVPTGWYYLGNGHRIYNPALNRFHSSDAFSPFAEGGLNSYAYCLGDPVNFTDSSGRFLDLIFPDLDPKFSAIFSIVTGASVGVFNLATGLKARQPGAPPLPLLSKVGANASLLGSLAAVAGGVMQLFGVQDGRYVSTFGVAFSGAGALMSMTPMIRDIVAHEAPARYIRGALSKRFRFEPPLSAYVPPGPHDWGARISAIRI